MANYEYKCVDCDITIEVSKPMSQADTVELCEKCGEAMAKQYGTFGINLKGPGFYSTDNR